MTISISEPATLGSGCLLLRCVGCSDTKDTGGSVFSHYFGDLNGGTNPALSSQREKKSSNNNTFPGQRRMK